jgi:eukaryotic-like serine/threonine-protein kinase
LAFVSAEGTSSHSSSVANYLGRTHRFFRQRVWLWPITASLGLGLIGWWVHTRIEKALKTKMAAELQAILNADVRALEIWFKAQKSNAATLASDARVRAAAEQLVELAKKEGTTDSVLVFSPQVAGLRDYLKPALQLQGYLGFLVVNRERRVLAAFDDQFVGKRALSVHEEFLNKTFAGQPTVSRPFASPRLLADEHGALRTGLPMMYVAAPIRNEHNEIFAVLGLRMRPESEFTEILGIARAGESGETFAFDRNGLLLSKSRFEDQLKSLGLIPDRPESRSILNVELRDPGVDLRKHVRADKPRHEQPLTAMARSAIAGQAGVNVEGYRDYRGVPVVSAWTWLEEYGLGIASKVDVEEAYRPLFLLRLAVWGLLGLLAVSAAVIFLFLLIVQRLERSARKAALAAKKLGQYALGEKIGGGANGVVYQAQHAFLRRPVAVKLLNLDKTSDTAIARFEREVQLTSHLTHPNTITIYDYGRTPEGIYYYAMEYLDGISLDKLGKEFGPQPEGRVIFILRQICGSLTEAHGVGLVHRDIKPANIILNRRGGQFDVVKVLDFGLAKAVDCRPELELTAADSVVGTPLYLAPEGIERPEELDTRSDLYSVGAIGYFLLTGKALFEVRNLRDVLLHQVKTMPQKPSARLGRQVSADLEEIIMQCLAKNPNDRPRTATDLETALAQCRSAAAWTRREAQAWWNDHITPSPEESPASAAGETQAFANVIFSR